MKTLVILALCGRSCSGKSALHSYIATHINDALQAFEANDQRVAIRCVKEYSSRAKRYRGENTYTFLSEKGYAKALKAKSIIASQETPIGSFGIGTDILFPDDVDTVIRIIPTNVSNYAQLCTYIYEHKADYDGIKILPLMSYFYVPNEVLLERMLERLGNLYKGRGFFKNVKEAQRRYEMETDMGIRDSYLGFNPYVFFDSYMKDMQELVTVYDRLDPKNENKIHELNQAINNNLTTYAKTATELFQKFHVQPMNILRFPYSDGRTIHKLMMNLMSSISERLK